jgi:hypothetical protein
MNFLQTENNSTTRCFVVSTPHLYYYKDQIKAGMDLAYSTFLYRPGSGLEVDIKMTLKEIYLKVCMYLSGSK